MATFLHLLSTIPSVLRSLFILTLFTLTLSPCQVKARSIAESLDTYRKETSITSLPDITARSFSGVALHQPSGVLYVVDNDNANIYQLSLAGELERIISTNNLLDPEGISHVSDRTFFIVEEGRATIHRVTIPVTGTKVINGSAMPSLQLAENWANNGLEGVSYRPADNTLFAVKELNPSRLYRVTLDEEQAFIASFENDPFSIENKDGDAAGIAALNDGNFIIINQQRNRLEGYGPEGELLSTFSLNMSKPEGIAVDSTSGTIYMVGEPREFCVLKPTTASVTTPAFAARPNFDCSIYAPGGIGRSCEATITLSSNSPVIIDCFTPDGKRFSTHHSVVPSGKHRLKFEQAYPTQGIYFIRIRAGEHQRVITLLL